LDRDVIEHATLVRVRYADTDQMKFVYYGKFFEYFEQGRSDLLRAVGLPYTEIEAMGLFLPVIEAHAEYRKAARYDDELRILTRLKDRPIARIRIDYEVTRSDAAEIIAEGYTIHTFVNAASGKPTRAPAQFIEIIESNLAERR
jgi:acyl-CoA thioester hydrolase